MIFMNKVDKNKLFTFTISLLRSSNAWKITCYFSSFSLDVDLIAKNLVYMHTITIIRDSVFA